MQEGEFRVSEQYQVAIVGATGAVGQKIAEKLVERNFPYSHIKLLASSRSAGQTAKVGGHTYTIEEAKPEAFDGVDFAFFSAGGDVSRKLAKEAAARGAVVIDNTSAFRMDPDTPLVVPEVNPQALHEHNGIIANPNCSTIQMVCVLEPLRQKAGLKKVIVSTYQAVSGSGAAAIDELTKESHALGLSEPSPQVLPVKSQPKHYPIAGNLLPQIDVFEENGFTFEEMKMMNETKKIMSLPDLSIAATCVRVPVVTGHSESVYLETEQVLSLQEIRDVLTAAEGVVLQDDPTAQLYPMPLYATDEDPVFVGRIRKDPVEKTGIHLWIVADNLLKGAALNSIQIAEKMIEQKEVSS